MMIIACDGSSLRDHEGNIGKGPIGWAFARDDGYWYSNGYPAGTNQQAELLGFIMALEHHKSKDKLLFQLDSKYVINITDSWMWGWARKGWVKSDGQPVANAALIKHLYELVNHVGRRNFSLEWVKGHDDSNIDGLNHVADLKATDASALVRSSAINAESFFNESIKTDFPQVEKPIYDKFREMSLR